MAVERVSEQLLRPEPFGPDILAETAFVGFGFRCWMCGLETGNISSLELCWNTFANALGPVSAKKTVNDLSCWVKSLRAKSGRALQILPTQCPGFCKDECLAISMIAAGQNDVCPAMRACAFALLETSHVDEPVATGLTFAETLRGEGVVLTPGEVMNAVTLIDADTVSKTDGVLLVH